MVLLRNPRREEVEEVFMAISHYSPILASAQENFELLGNCFWREGLEAALGPERRGVITAPPFCFVGFQRWRVGFVTFWIRRMLSPLSGMDSTRFFAGSSARVPSPGQRGITAPGVFWKDASRLSAGDQSSGGSTGVPGLPGLATAPSGHSSSFRMKHSAHSFWTPMNPEAGVAFRPSFTRTPLRRIL